MEKNKTATGSNNATITLKEDLVASVVPSVRSEMKQLIGEKLGTLTVDMARVTMVDSSGIGCLVAAHNSLMQKDGKLVIINVSQEILELFQSMRLDRHFSISRSV